MVRYRQLLISRYRYGFLSGPQPTALARLALAVSGSRDSKSQRKRLGGGRAKGEGALGRQQIGPGSMFEPQGILKKTVAMFLALMCPLLMMLIGGSRRYHDARTWTDAGDAC